MLPFASTGSGESDFVTERSACDATIVVVFAESLPGVGSVVADVTVAVADITVPPAVPESTCTTSVNIADCDAGRPLIEHDTIPVAPTAGVVHDHACGDASDTNVVLVGIACDRLTP